MEFVKLELEDVKQSGRIVTIDRAIDLESISVGGECTQSRYLSMLDKSSRL